MRLTIGKKLNFMIISLLGLSISLVVLASVKDFTDNLTQNMARSTINTATMMAARVRSEIRQLIDHGKVLGTASRSEFKYDSDRTDYIQQNLGGARSHFMAVGMFVRETASTPAESSPRSRSKFKAKNKSKNAKHVLAEKKPEIAGKANYRKRWQVINPNKFAGFEKDADLRKRTLNQFNDMENQHQLNFDALYNGVVEFKMAQLPGNKPVIRMGVPFVMHADKKFHEFLVMEIDQSELGNIIKDSGSVTSFLIDRNGMVLGTSDPVAISEGTNASKLSIVQAALSALNNGSKRDGQLNFADLNNVMQMGAFNVVDPLSGLSVIAQIPLAVAEKAKNDLFFKAGTLGGMFLFLAIALGFLFSRSISNPIQALAHAAERVKNGDFKVRLNTKKTKDGHPPKSADEIQQFSFTFNEMVTGLEERDRYRDTMNKIQDPEVAKLLVSGELHLGGERKSCAVFFSDIRGFTSLSESIEAEALVALLNRYMTKMVAVIKRHGGTVDKFVGDAIMAIWGAPISRDNDAEMAIRACLGMRMALAELNEEFAVEGIPPIKMGMGLNYGSLIAGQMGSEERMDYTAIGETVNTAARIEASTKAFGTDLLISSDVLEQVQGKFVVEKVSEIQAKGVSEALKIYKVNGYIDENGQEKIVATPWSSYKAEGADKIKVLDENKDQAKLAPPPSKPQFEKTADIYVPPRGQRKPLNPSPLAPSPSENFPGIIPAQGDNTGNLNLKRASTPANVLPPTKHFDQAPPQAGPPPIVTDEPTGEVYGFFEANPDSDSTPVPTAIHMSAEELEDTHPKIVAEDSQEASSGAPASERTGKILAVPLAPAKTATLTRPAQTQVIEPPKKASESTGLLAPLQPLEPLEALEPLDELGELELSSALEEDDDEDQAESA